MSAAQFQANPNQTTTPDDRLWTDRYSGVLTYENASTTTISLVQKVWIGLPGPGHPLGQLLRPRPRLTAHCLGSDSTTPGSMAASCIAGAAATR